jgi:hypothetical protein
MMAVLVSLTAELCCVALRFLLLRKEKGDRMNIPGNVRASFVVSAGLVALALVSAAKAEPALEKFDAKNFDDKSAVIDNEWFPLKPGMRYTWDGFAVDEEGDEETHSVVFTVTDLVKEIAGVKTLVCWDRDYVDKELEESEIMFVAQDKNGDVWLMGEYPEEYDNGVFAQQVSWIHGIKDGHAGIRMKKDPKVGMTYSQGWAPSVEYTDRALVAKVGQKIKTPAGDFDDVIVIDETNNETPGAHHLKFYAKGVGSVHINGYGSETDQEKMDLIKIEKISAEEMEKAREESLKLDRHGYEVSKDVYALTKPIDAAESTAADE